MPARSTSETAFKSDSVLIDLFDEGVRTVSPRIAHTRLTLPDAVRQAARDTADAVLRSTSLGPLEVDSVRSRDAQALAHAAQVCRPAVCEALHDFGLALEDRVEASLLVCRGARYHHDAMGFADTFFVVLWLGTAKGLELVFPHTGVRVPLEFGTLVVFDGTQPHGVVRQGEAVAQTSSAHGLDAQCFLSWDPPIQTETAQRWFGLTTYPEGPPEGFVGGLASALSADRVCERTGQWFFGAEDRWPRIGCEEDTLLAETCGG